MKRKILALILTAAMLLTSVPVIASAGTSHDPLEKYSYDNYKVEANNVGTSNNPLTVKYNSTEGINYLALGDSVSYGFGTSGENGTTDKKYGFNWLFDFTKEGVGVRYDCEIPNSYPVLIKNYLNTVNTTNFKQRSVSIARVEDICTFIDADKYQGDSYYNSLVKGFMLLGVTYENGNPSSVALPQTEEGEIDYTSIYSNSDEYIVKDDDLNSDYGGAVDKADFITISAGGNNFYGYLLLTEMLNMGTTSDLSKYYGTAFENEFGVIKKAIVAKAKILDSKTNKNAESEDSYQTKVESLFSTLEGLLYTTAGYVKNTSELLDLIHEKNSDAVVAITGMPEAYAEYDVKIGSIVIDLEKILVPAFSILNNTIKNAAESRSSYVRYIDISGVDLVDPSVVPATYKGNEEAWDGKTVDLDDFETFFYSNMEISHPSELGHKQIANKIMENFKVVEKDNAADNVISAVKNIWTSLMSLTGISKIRNLLTSLLKFDFLNLIKFDFK